MASFDASGEPVAVAFDAADQLVVQSRQPAQLEFQDGTVIALSTESRADTGHTLFHMNSGAGLACASCHPEGRDDGHLWQFDPIGSRRTQAIPPGFLSTAPFHWSGDMASFDQLVSDVFVFRMGAFQPSAEQTAAFAGWLDSLEAPSATAGLDGTAIARGQVLFQSEAVGCSRCHSGDRLTNNQNYDVGTGGIFQVPSLIGVAARAPYLHDGCAPTLLDRFGLCGGGDQHGITSSLSQADLGDLVAYLESL
jgi:mono/diheme cytochrome c family protein